MDFGWTREGAQQLYELMDLGPRLRLMPDWTVNSIHAFLYMLYHIRSPSERLSLDSQKFGYDYSSLSRIFNCMLEKVDSQHGFRLQRLEDAVATDGQNFKNVMKDLGKAGKGKRGAAKVAAELSKEEQEAEDEAKKKRRKESAAEAAAALATPMVQMCSAFAKSSERDEKTADREEKKELEAQKLDDMKRIYKKLESESHNVGAIGDWLEDNGVDDGSDLMYLSEDKMRELIQHVKPAVQGMIRKLFPEPIPNPFV